MDEWLDRLADVLEVSRISGEEVGAVLKLARDVAHGVERRFAPVSAYLIGVAVGMRTASGATREDAFHGAAAATRDLVPEARQD